MGNGVLDAISKKGSDLGTIIINLSTEFPGFLKMIYILMVLLGTLIVISGIIELGKRGKPGEQSKATFSSIFWKCFGGGSLAVLPYSISAWTNTLWADTDPLDINKYVIAEKGMTATSAGYAQAAITAASGIIVLTGVVTIARAYIGIARLGKTPEEQRGDLWGYIVSRLVAGSALVSITYLADAVGKAAGFGGFG